MTRRQAAIGFFEREAARTTDTFGQIVHVFSTCESRKDAGDAKPERYLRSHLRPRAAHD